MQAKKVGIIGLGMVGKIHLEMLNRIPQAEVIAAAEKDDETAELAMEKYNIPKVYNDWKDLIADPDIEVIHNCTPNFMHFEINKKIIDKGIPLLSEKPLGMDLEETKKSKDMAEEKGIPAGINFGYRHYPTVQWARSLIADGYLGEIKAVHGTYLQDWLMFKTDYNWRVESKLGGKSRALADIGLHWVDMLRYLTGLEVEEVIADYATLIPKREKPTGNVETFADSEEMETEEIDVDTEDWASVLLRLNNNVRGDFTISQISAGNKNNMKIEIDGSKRSLTWKQEDPEHLYVGERGGANHVLYKSPGKMSEKANQFASYPGGHPEGFADAVKNTFISFYQGIENNNTDYPTFAEAYEATKIIDAIMESKEKDKWIKV